MYVKNTTIGGLFSVLFVLTALMLISASLVYYIGDNITENKALVPLASQYNEIDHITADITLHAKFENYGG